MVKLFDKIKVENLELPRLVGNNIDEHITHIARQQTDVYSKLMTHFSFAEVPEMPSEFSFEPGWTKLANRDMI